MKAQFEIDGIPDAVGICVETLPNMLEDAVDLSNHWQAKPGELLLCVPHVATYRVRDGQTIEVAPADDADPAAVEVFLYGAARAALLHQRGELPLHASSLAPPGSDQAIAFCGDSGVGKSTLSCELSRRGWKLVADDTTRIQWTANKPLVWPSGRAVKLWQDACDDFGVDSSRLSRVRKTLAKFYVELPSISEPLPLRTVVELSRTEGGTERLGGITERMSVLTRHAFRPRQIAGLGVQAEHLQIVARVAGACAIGVLHGCRIDTVKALADRVEEIASWPD